MTDKLPPVDGVEYPDHPGEDASAVEMMQYMEKVDHYWSVRGRQKIESDKSGDEEEDEEPTDDNPE